MNEVLDTIVIGVGAGRPCFWTLRGVGPDAKFVVKRLLHHLKR